MQQCDGQGTSAADAACHSSFSDRVWVGKRSSTQAAEDEHLGKPHPSYSSIQEPAGWRFSVMTYNILADQYVRLRTNVAFRFLSIRGSYQQ